MRGRRRSRPREVFDVVTPTDAERRRADQHEREVRYRWLMGSCLICILIGFFLPLPVPLRGGFLLVGAVLLPAAAVVGNARRVP